MIRKIGFQQQMCFLKIQKWVQRIAQLIFTSYNILLGSQTGKQLELWSIIVYLS